MKKVDCKKRLVQCRANLFFGFLGIESLKQAPRSELLKIDHVVIQDASVGYLQRVEFGDIALILRDDNNWETTRQEFAKMLLRMFILDSFEIIRKYCAISRQMALLKGQSWYDFASIMRNCCGHNYKFEFWPSTIEKLTKGPAQWRGKEINLSMNGTDWMLSWFAFKEANDLYWDMMDTLEETLK